MDSGHATILEPRKNLKELMGDEKFRRILRSWCLNGEATTNIVITNNAKTNNIVA